MDKNTWNTVKALFEQAIELSEVERRAWLSDRAPSREISVLVEGMLQADAHIDATIRPALAEVERIDALLDSELTGHRVGAYEIHELIGRGGMGSVYRAERQSEGVSQRVALKVIRHSQLGPQTRERFQLERQILARLDHPNIARLIDFGTLRNQAYYAMEYVDGEPVTAYCDRCHLSLEARIDLFQQVCAAVSHAHRNLVVHRDIKPSNVLVNFEGQPKLVDFGIAKPLQDEVSIGEETATQNRYISPYCAAPEMLRGETVTTACDVYALGALLYELLAGVKPYDFSEMTYGEIERTIVEVTPARLSVRVAAEGTESVAQARGYRGPQALSVKLRGDLDTIVLRALAKEPQRRYSSVEAFSDDLRRKRTGLPVRAQADRMTYRVGKFLRRHRLGVGMSTALALLLVASSIALWLQWQQVRIQRDHAVVQQQRAEQVSHFLVDTFRSADPTNTLGERITARQILDQGLIKLRQEMPGARTVKADLLHTMAEAYIGLGLFATAEELATEALTLRRGQPLEADSARQLAHIANELGSFEISADFAEQARAFDPTDPANLIAVATAWANMGREAEAETLLRQAVDTLRGRASASVQTGQARQRLADRARSREGFEEARALYLEALGVYRAVLPPHDPIIAGALAGLSIAERSTGNLEKARDAALESLRSYQAVYGESHPSVGRAWSAVGNLYLRLDQHHEAAEAMQKSLDLIAQFYGAESPRAAMAHYNLGRIYHGGLDDLVTAESHYRAAYDIATALDFKNLDFFRLGLGSVLSIQGRLDESGALLRASLDGFRALGGPDTSAVAHAESELAEVLLRQCHPEPAQSLLEHAIAVFQQQSPPPEGAVIKAQVRLERARQLTRSVATADAQQPNCAGTDQNLRERQ